MHELNIDTSDLIQKAIFWGLIPQLCLWFVVHYCQKYYGVSPNKLLNLTKNIC